MLILFSLVIFAFCKSAQFSRIQSVKLVDESGFGKFRIRLDGNFEIVKNAQVKLVSQHGEDICNIGRDSLLENSRQIHRVTNELFFETFLVNSRNFSKGSKFESKFKSKFGSKFSKKSKIS